MTIYPNTYEGLTVLVVSIVNHLISISKSINPYLPSIPEKGGFYVRIVTDDSGPMICVDYVIAENEGSYQKDTLNKRFRYLVRDMGYEINKHTGVITDFAPSAWPEIYGR